MIQAKQDENIEFKWGKKRGVGGKKKDVQFYESFTYDGVEYALYDSVYLYGENEPEPYIGKIIKIWQNSDKSKRVKILWFFRPFEISNYLQGSKTSENELFLASGGGVGHANVNPLEAIAGKCNVICTSKDSRNPQPSNKEIQMADFTFYRTFDVDRYVILDKLDDKIAQVDVKFLLNKVNSQNSSPVPERNSIKEFSGNATADGITLPSEMNALMERRSANDSSIDSIPKENADSKVLLANQRSPVGQKPASDALEENTFSRSEVKDNTVSLTLDVKQKSSLGEKPIPNIVGKFCAEAKISDPQKDTASDKISSRTKGKEVADLKPSLAKQKSTLGEKHASNLVIDLDGIDKNKKQESLFNGKITSRSPDGPVMGDSKVGKVSSDEVQVEEKVKAAEDSGRFIFSRFANKPLKNDKHDGYFEASDSNKVEAAQKLIHDSKGCDAKAVDQAATASGEKFKRKLSMGPSETEIISSKKQKVDEKLTKSHNEKLSRESLREVPNDANRTGNKILEVTRRPEADKSKWFKGLPWEERLKDAHAEGRLVLLQNVDPSCTGSEVEDIVWHALKQNCTAKMIPRAAFSSPHSGQAYAIFRTREAAETAVTKLDEGCLMILNGGPLIASIAKLSFPRRPSMFFGHMSMDKFRHQMQREMREAVSTSHCSQPNTLEYDMALEWCLLQEQTNLEWELLFKCHGRELAKLEATMMAK